MIDAEVARTYWAAIGQTAGVFAIPLVLEARRSVSRWRETKPAVRRIHGIFYFLAAIAIFDAVATSLFNLLLEQSSFESMAARTISLSFVAAGLVINPVYSFLLATNRDVLIVVNRAMPWSLFRQLRRAYRRTEQRFAGLARATLKARRQTLDFIRQMETIKSENAASDKTLATLMKPLEKLLASIEKPDGSSIPMEERTMLLNNALSAAVSDEGLGKSIDEHLQQLRDHLNKLDQKILAFADQADVFDATRPRLGLLYFDSEDRKKLESEVRQVADEAAGRLTSPPDLLDARLRGEDATFSAVSLVTDNFLLNLGAEVSDLKQ